MKNYVADGNTVGVIAPTGGLVSGVPILIGSLFGVPVATVAAGSRGALTVMGEFDLPRATSASSAWAAGDKIYWDDTAKLMTKVATSNTLRGVAVEASLADGDLTGRIRLTGQI